MYSKTNIYKIHLNNNPLHVFPCPTMTPIIFYILLYYNIDVKQFVEATSKSKYIFDRSLTKWYFSIVLNWKFHCLNSKIIKQYISTMIKNSVKGGLNR